MVNTEGTDHVGQIESLIGEFGGDEWIERNIPSEGSPQFNPIAFWVKDYRGAALRDMSSLGSNESFLRLSYLAYLVALLRDSGTAHLEARIVDLRDGSEERVRSAIHEIHTAGDYAIRGDSVAFITETTSRTPDISINGNIEVECKYKAGAFSVRDKARMALYTVFTGKLQKLYHGGVQAKGLVVEATFESEPTRQMVDRILADVRSCLRPVRGEPMHVVEGDQEYTITVVPGEQEIAEGVYIPHGKDIHAEFFSLSGTVADRGNGGLGLTRPIAIGLTCKVELDIVGTIRSSIKSAIGQFSGDCAGVVAVDIGDLLGKVDFENIPGFSEMIQRLFRSNSRLSRVEFFASYFEEIDGQMVFQRMCYRLDNPSARFPVGD